ncbi:MAG TPA: DUF3558 family protein [Pseudonocardiaceae bacterium]|nr:DUF3558 family protein [Pseudonocardiaceae bacterium]
MRRALAVVMALVAAGCGSPGLKADPSKIDMCTILTDQELHGLGVTPDSRRPVEQPGSVGCAWLGPSFTLGLERDKDTVASYKTRQRGPAFIAFTENTVNGRAGVRFAVNDGRTACEQLIDGGSVSLVVSVARAAGPGSPASDSCARALRIAQLIEPRLPKAGS